MSNSNNSNIVNTTKVYIYENLPSQGGARKTLHSLIHNKPKNISFHILKGIKSSSRNIISYLFDAIVRAYIHEKNLVSTINTNYPIIIFQNWMTNSPYILKIATNKMVYILHEPLREFYDKGIQYQKKIKDLLVDILKIPVYFLDKYLIRSTKANIVTNSEFSKNNIEKCYRKKSVVIYPGYDDKNYFYIKNFKKENQCISVGSINPIKNQRFLIQVLSHIPISDRPKLVLVGNGGDDHYIDELKLYAKSVMVDLKVIINTSDIELNHQYNKSIFFIYNPINEPFGIAVLEAMAVGLPIFAKTKGGGYCEVVTDKSGILFNSEDALEWGMHISAILSNSRKLIEIRNHNIQQAKKYTYNMYQKNILKLLKHI